MQVWVVYHLEPGYEITLVKVVDSETKAIDYIKNYEKDNHKVREYQRVYADKMLFHVE